MTAGLHAKEMSRVSEIAPVGQADVCLRPFPFPYRAMLAICSDLDCTPHARVYEEMMRFLNTTRQTSVGPGVGLEVGNTIYFDMPPDQFSYGNTDDAGRAMVRDLIRSGHVDCLHSFGDLATTRAHASAALEELQAHDCHVDVWVDHSKAPSNFGPDIMAGRGDDAKSPVYHADLSCRYGIQFVWRGRTTSVIGQNAPSSLQGLSCRRHLFASCRTMAKQALKFRLGRRGDPRYEMHDPNRVLRVDKLRDGTPIYEFMRFNPHWHGVGDGATAEGIAEVLTPRVLDTLVARNAVGVLYTHLGKIHDESEFFHPATVKAFQLLREYQQQGKILVTTTRRLLGYLRTCEELKTALHTEAEGSRLDLSTNSAVPKPTGRVDRKDFDGLTFYGDLGHLAGFTLDGSAGQNLQKNPADETGRTSVSVPWTKLEYPR